MSAKYDDSSIDVLEGLEAVRKRPGMFISDTGARGFHHLLFELVDNSVDEAMGGYCTRVEVQVANDPQPAASVRDDGRGIPLGKHKTGRPTIEVIFTTLHAGGKFGGGSYKVSGGLHGVGSSVVCALSSSLTVTSRRDGQLYRQEFSRGVPNKPTRAQHAQKPGDAHGTTVSYVPDAEIFGSQEFDLDLVRERLKVKAYLNPGVTFALNDEEFCFGGGLRDMVAAQVRDDGMVAVTDTFVVSLPELQVALAWTTDTRSDELVQGFANGIPTPDGGTHVLGLRTTVSEVVREMVAARGLAPRRLAIEAEDVREGMVGAVHVLVTNPQFQGQTKDRLNNPEVRGLVSAEVRKALAEWLTRNGQQAQRLAERVVEAARARTASRAAVIEVRRQSPVARLMLPGKLADCSSTDPAVTELFLVEGDSAGGSGKQGRDRRTQAILPLRGKVLNTVDVSWKKLESNVELANVIQALGCGYGPDFDISGLRYGKVVLLMDADTDGLHIATLLMAFFHKAMPGLVRAGHLYLACPPLFRIEVGADTLWARDEDERDEFLAALPKRARASAEVSYFKGLGEMPPAMLFSTTMDPRTRRLEQVTIPDGREMETAAVLQDLLGADVDLRLPHIMKYSEERDA